MAGLSRSKLEQLSDMAKLANAAYSGAPVPQGWSNVTGSLTKLAGSYKSGGYYANGAAAAAVFRDADGRLVISIRGTDSSADYRDDLGLALGSGSYYQKFIPLIAAVRQQFPDAHLTFTGHSLGGAAVHQIAGWGDARVAGSSYYAFSSPILDNASKVTDAGFVDDDIYASLGSIGQADLRYLHYDGTSSTDAHRMVNLADVLDRLPRSEAFIGAGGGFSMPTNAVIYALGQASFTGGSTSPNSGFSTPVYVIGRDSLSFAHPGNSGKDTIHGFDHFAVKQIIDGMGGNDTIYGGASGWNILLGGKGNDQLFGRSARDELFGGAGGDRLSAGSGADTLHGGTGVDTLIGGTGADRFVFDAKADVAAGADHITDFADGTDKIALAVSGFGLAAGAAYVVASGASPAPSSGTMTMLYNTSTGVLSVDVDGTGGAGAIALAVLDNHPASLSHGDILII